ncbi:hypothetical protein TNCV_3255761 [Trichonephila clavipes]|nr:hypothetical protein TNCV_3255761 [Trichonephila clavipes]
MRSNRATQERSEGGKLSIIGLNCPTATSEEFVALDDDNSYTSPMMTDKDIFDFFQSSKNVTDADSEDEKEMNNAASVSPSSEISNIMKSMFSYLDAYSNDKMKNKMDDIEKIC